MAKQKCGTCRFFQEAGLAGSGWCHHPDRKTSNGVMIMVRRNELACRNEWQSSLWMPRDGEHGEEPAFQRTPALGPVAPATPDHLRALLAADAGSTSDPEGEDVLLSEARIISEAPAEPAPIVPAARAKPLAAPTAGFDARSAVFRAREAYRERVRAKAVQERPSIRAQSAPPARTSLDARDAMAGAEPSESVSVARSTLSHEEPRTARSPSHSPAPNGEDTYHERQTEPGPRDREIVRSPAGASNRETMAPADWHAHPAAAHAQPELTVDVAEPGVCPPEPVEREPEPVAAPRQRPQNEDDLPAWFRTDLPRACRACRDFRPSGDGQRGWCANSWAFTHSQMVHADDIAPCLSAIGDWWAPVDDVWLVAADVSSHGRPTPLLDRLLGDESRKRRRS